MPTARKPKREPARRRSAQQARDSRSTDLVQAAGRVFLEHGYDGASMELVAAQAGVTRKTIYNHFSGKDALFAAVAISLCQQVVTAFDDVGQHSGTIEERLVGFCKAIIGLLISAPGLEIYRLIVGIVRRFPDLAKTLRDSAEEAITAALTRHLDEEVASGALEIPDTRRAAFILIGVATGVVQRAMLGEPLRPDSADTDAYVREAVLMFCMRYRSPAARPRSTRRRANGSLVNT